MRPDATALSGILKSGGITAEVTEPRLGVVARIPATDALTALKVLHAAGFEMLVDLFGTDTGEDVEITYHVRSFSRDEEVYVKTNLPYDGELSSSWNIYPAALYPEREAAEMLGLVLRGHPNPKRLLTSDEFDVPALRKSVAVRTHNEVARPGIRREAEEGEEAS